MAKQSRLKKEYRKNASKLHKAVGDMLHESPIFSNYRIYQEYPVNRVSPYFDSGREKFDWVILDLMVVIECHGQQHYKPVRFGGITEQEAKDKFQAQVMRDLEKKLAAEKAGWIYVIFKFDEKDITSSALATRIVIANKGTVVQDRNTVSQQVKQKKKRKEDKTYRKEQLRKAKEYRKQKYREQKERRNAAKRREKESSGKS